MLEKPTITKRKNVFHRHKMAEEKKSVNLKVGQQRLPKMKCKRKKKKRIKKNPRTVVRFQNFNIIVIGIPETVERENREEIFEIIMAENFPKFM